MATAHPSHAPRGFREVTLSRGYVQTGAERFGDNEVPELIATWDREYYGGFGDDLDEEMDALDPMTHVPPDQITTENPWAGRNPPPVDKRVPKMQHHRNNLTALSQKHNLYFAAYENRLFVYRPRTVPMQTLPSDPDLILATEPDSVASEIGGTQDPVFYHQSNSLAVGFLGRREVAVLAYDDGSVIAFYIDQIASHIEQSSCGAKKPDVPKPFFHDNVGCSAWGLAVHQASRLIAVSSNRFEVTVFAFGLTGRHPGPPAGNNRAGARGPSFAARAVAQRARNWRIVLLLGEGAHNVPNISFWDDRDGFAAKVCGMDIRGNTWILDIWTSSPPTKIAHMDPASQPVIRNPGWSVAVIPFTSFVSARSGKDALGFSEPTRADIHSLNGSRRRHLDITPTLSSVRDVPGWPNGRPPLATHGLFIALPPAPPLHPPHDIDAAANAAAIAPATPLPPHLNPDDYAHTATSDDEAMESEESYESEEEEESEEDDEDFDQDELSNYIDANNNTNTTSVADPDQQTNQAASTADWGAPLGIAQDDADAFMEDDDGLPGPPNDALVGVGEETILVSLDIGAIHTRYSINILPRPEPPGTPLGLVQVTATDAARGLIKRAEGIILGERVDGNDDEEDDEWASGPDMWQDMVYFPDRDRTYVLPGALEAKMRFLRRPRETNRAVSRPTTTGRRGSSTRADSDSAAMSGACLLRTYLKDIELCGIDGSNSNGKGNNSGEAEDEIGVVCHDPVGQPLLRGEMPAQIIQRLNMIQHVPELSLIVVGSALGRVVLLTPTVTRNDFVRRGVEKYRQEQQQQAGRRQGNNKNGGGNGGGSGNSGSSGNSGGNGNRNSSAGGSGSRGGEPSARHGFRVDWVLPKASDEDAGIKPDWPLYGMAVGPVQEGGFLGGPGSLLLRQPGSRRRTVAGPGTRRYRLMLHYRDHSILTYEMSRDDEGKLEVF